MCSIHNVVTSVSLLRGRTEYMKVVCSIHFPLYLFFLRGSDCIYEYPLFDQRFSVSLWESGSVSLFVERDTALDGIYERRFYDPC